MNTERLREFYAGRRILIVGGDGFLGRNAVETLSVLSAHLTVLTRRPSAEGAIGHRLVGDLKDPETARMAVRDQEIVFDFVGVTSAVNSNRDPCLSLMEECFPHLNLLTACAEAREPPLIIFPSSRLVYGKPITLPVDEAHPTDPTNVYSVHKLTVENYLRIYQQTRGIPNIIFRISNPYGPYQPNTHKGYGIINYFLQLAARGEPIRIFGDGAQIRDYVHVDDLTTMMLLAIMNPACRGEIFNLGGYAGISFRAAAETIARTAGGTPIVFDPWPKEYRDVETGSYVTSMAKLSRFIDLPEPTAFEDGVRRAIVAYRAR